MSNLKDQVLSIKQVQELIELGFDVSKYASMCWLKEPNGDKLLITTLDESCYEAACMNPVPTLAIGDIISVLPVKIEEDYFFSVNSEYCAYSMVGGIDTIFFTSEKEITNNLFKALVWCIKEKHLTT